MSSPSKQDLLKTITSKDIKEICKNNGLKGYSSLNRDGLINFATKNLNLSTPQIQSLVNHLQEAKLITKVKDSEDFLLRKVVNIESCEDELILATVDSLKVKIYNLGKDDFSYFCDGKCKDYIYRVKQEYSPYCKHYPAVIGELIYQEKIDLDNIQPNHLSGKKLEALIEIIEKRKKEDGLLVSDDRNIGNTLENLKHDIMEISCKNTALAREKYNEPPEKVFITMVDDAFQLLEYETILNRRNEGWDLLVLGTYAPQPYIAVISTKPAHLGKINKPNLLNLKNFCLDMCRDQLMGAYKDAVKYMVLVAPDFPEDITSVVAEFQELTGGIKLSFLPVSTLLYLVERYRENPILTHQSSEYLYKKDIITKEDVDEIFNISEKQIADLSSRARMVLRTKMEDICKRHSDACYIKMDEIYLQHIIEEVINTLKPHLLKQGLNDATGIKTFSLNHDYYLLWGRVLQDLVEEFSAILEEQSLSQVQRSPLKEDLIKYLDL